MGGIGRRQLLTGSCAALACRPAIAAGRLTAVESRVGGRLGVSAITARGRALLAFRADERFPMASTFKVLLAGAILDRVERGAERLDRVIPYGQADLLPNSPITAAHVAAGGLPLEQLCQAIIQVSDNAAANLLLASVGGPAAVTAFARGLGDPVTRLDRTELTLNEGTPGDPRDTTSPAAMSADVGRLLFGGALAPTNAARLADWMRGTTTGLKRLRAGAPATWQAGDKTGTGGHGSTNDVAVFWRPQGSALIVSAYLTGSSASESERELALADVGRIAAEAASHVRLGSMP